MSFCTLKRFFKLILIASFLWIISLTFFYDVRKTPLLDMEDSDTMTPEKNPHSVLDQMQIDKDEINQLEKITEPAKYNYIKPAIKIVDYFLGKGPIKKPPIKNPPPKKQQPMYNKTGIVVTEKLVNNTNVTLKNEEILRNQSSLNDIRSETWCFDEYTDLQSANMLSAMKTLLSNRPPIFFIESTCKSREAGRVTLTPRQACAIESAAKMNQNSDIYVLLVSQAMLIKAEDRISDRILNQLLTYPNIYFRYINLPQYTKNTPLEEWYKKKLLHTSSYLAWHTSDMLRVLTLWKYGGTYLDLDVIVVSSLEKLKPNYAGAESDGLVNNGVLNFERDGTAHKLLEMQLDDIRLNYKPYMWLSNGPGVITRILQTTCGVMSTKDMTLDRCHGFKVYPPETFYAIHYSMWKYLFVDTHNEEIFDILAQSKVVHFWNKMSMNEKIVVGSKVPYALLAEQFCPKVYKNSGKYF